MRNPLTLLGKLISGTTAGTLQEIDERDLLKGLTGDAFSGIADDYEMVIPEIRIRFERKKPKETQHERASR